MMPNQGTIADRLLRGQTRNTQLNNHQIPTRRRSGRIRMRSQNPRTRRSLETASLSTASPSA